MKNLHLGRFLIAGVFAATLAACGSGGGSGSSDHSGSGNSASNGGSGSSGGSSSSKAKLLGFYLGDVDASAFVKDTGGIIQAADAPTLTAHILLDDGSFWGMYLDQSSNGAITNIQGIAWGKGKLSKSKLTAKSFNTLWRNRGNHVGSFSTDGGSLDLSYSDSSLSGTENVYGISGSFNPVTLDAQNFLTYPQSSILSSAPSEEQGTWRVLDLSIQAFVDITLDENGNISGTYDNGTQDAPGSSIDCAISGKLTPDAQKKYFNATFVSTGSACQNSGVSFDGVGVFTSGSGVNVFYLIANDQSGSDHQGTGLVGIQALSAQ
jgi:hypothetical protein